MVIAIPIFILGCLFASILSSSFSVAIMMRKNKRKLSEAEVEYQETNSRLTGQFIAIEKKLNEVEGELRLKITDFDEQSKQLKQLQGEKSQLSSQISNLQQQHELDFCNSTKESENELNHCQQELESIITDLNRESAHVQSLTQKNSELLERIEKLQNRYDSDIRSLEESIKNEKRELFEKVTYLVDETSRAAKFSDVFERWHTDMNSLMNQNVEMHQQNDKLSMIAQTVSILSLNARIEAARAGESGRGFLVVAREIRRLADQTASATLDIEKMVQQMQAAVSGGVMEMDRFSEQVRRGVTTVGDVGLRLTKVIDQVSGVESSFSEVTEAMQQQTQGADQIRQAMDGLSKNASRAQEATSEFSSASESLREAIFSLRKVISGELSV